MKKIIKYLKSLRRKARKVVHGKPEPIVFKVYPGFNELPNIVQRAFKKNNFLSVSELCGYTREEIDVMSGFGPKTMEQLDIFFQTHDLKYLKSEHINE